VLILALDVPTSRRDLAQAGGIFGISDLRVMTTFFCLTLPALEHTFTDMEPIWL